MFRFCSAPSAREPGHDKTETFGRADRQVPHLRRVPLDALLCRLGVALRRLVSAAAGRRQLAARVRQGLSSPRLRQAVHERFGRRFLFPRGGGGVEDPRWGWGRVGAREVSVEREHFSFEFPVRFCCGSYGIRFPVSSQRIEQTYYCSFVKIGAISRLSDESEGKITSSQTDRKNNRFFISRVQVLIHVLWIIQFKVSDSISVYKYEYQPEPAVKILVDTPSSTILRCNLK